MALPIDITFANPPEGTCPDTFADAVTLLQALVSAEITTSYTPYVMGANTPAVEDQDKAWIRLDGAGRPLGTFVFYAGSWRRQYNGKFNEVTMFNGNPALFFDGTGRGLTTNEWDGWSLCNGQNGTPNLTDKFIVAAHMDNSAGQTGYSSGWRSMVSGGIAATGGTNSVTLGPTYVYSAPKAAVIVDLFSATGDARSTSGALFGHHSGVTGPTGTEELVPADAGNPSPSAFQILPPYYALAYAIFTGYA